MSKEDVSDAGEGTSSSEPRAYESHPPVRPLIIVQDNDGNRWLCDKGVDPTEDLKEQGCWRCEEMAFPDGGR